MRSGERDRVSLSHAAAIGETTSLAKLAAPPSAQKRRDKLKSKARLGEMMGYMVPARKREAKPPRRIEKTSAEPTPERQAKEPNGWDHTLHAGGQIQHRPRVFLDVFGHHVPDHLIPALELLQDAWEVAGRVRATSDRAYTGKPFGGASPDRVGHGIITDKDRQRLELFSYAMEHLCAQTPEWWERLKTHILREPPERTGRLQTIAELGAFWTGYKKGTDNSTASGVMAVNDALLRWYEAVQAGAMKLQYARMRRRAAHEDELLRYTAEQKARQDRANALRRERNEHFTGYLTTTKRKP